LPARVHDLLDDGEQVEGRAGEAVDPRHRHHVSGAKGFQQPRRLAPGGRRTAGLLTVNPGAPLRAQLHKLGVERTADFVICRHCGVFIAAILNLSTEPYAVVNVNCLDDRAFFTAPATMHEFQSETLDARTSRRTANWMPAVVQR
jgi:hypothetical protein